MISPLLANIALHGLASVAHDAHKIRGRGRTKHPSLIRYADDFVVLCETREGAEEVQKSVERWLAGRGLQLSVTKTRIVHTTPQSGEGGFDFLGFNVRHYPVGKYHAGKTNSGTRLSHKLLIKPSKKSVKQHIEALSRIMRRNKATAQADLIGQLNPVIRGWANYHRTVVAKEIFSYCDYVIYLQLRRWTRRRHPNKNAAWVTHRYWRDAPGSRWDFVARQDGRITAQLADHAAIPIRRHIKVKGTASVFDGNLPYWAQRLTDHPLTRGDGATLLRQQNGRCTYCGLMFRPEDLREIDHRIPKGHGGADILANKQILHRHCHDQKTATDAARALLTKTR